jgi:arabinogalactan oligomer/maltooligosaccharide transport system substrate-binding protein
VEFFYNKDMLPTPPATTDDLKKAMEGGTPIAISFSCYHYWGFYSDFGGKIFDDKFQFVSDQGTGMTDAMTYLNDLYQIAKKNGWPKTDTDALAPFSEGKVAAVTNGNWAMGDYKKALGDKLGVAPLPAGPAGKATPLLGVDGFMFNPNSQNQDAALQVALYLTNKASQTKMMTDAGHIPANTTVEVTDPLLKSFLDAVNSGNTVRPQDAQMAKYWANFCGSDQVFEKGTAPADWIKTATDAAKK